MPAQPPSALQYNLTQDYLEVARAALTQIHGKVPAGENTPAPPFSNELANAVFFLRTLSHTKPSRLRGSDWMTSLRRRATSWCTRSPTRTTSTKICDGWWPIPRRGHTFGW